MSLQNKLTQYLKGTALQAVQLSELKHKIAASKSTVSCHSKTELPNLQYLRNSVRI